MTKRHALSFASTTLLVAFVIADAAAAPADQAGKKGVVWESTTEMEASGMVLPPQTARHCAPEGEWKEPPPTQPGDSQCRVTDLKQSGKTTSWKMACDGPEKMSGQGTMTRDGDAYRGTMTFSGTSGSGRMKLSGRKVGGACVVGQPLPGDNRQAEIMALMEQSKQDTAKGIDKECRKAARDVEPALFLMTGTFTCKGTPHQAEFCKRLQTVEGFQRASKAGEETLEKAAGLCQVDLVALRGRFCSEAAQRKDLAFLGSSCPAERKALAQKECAGKEDSNLAPGIRDFCLAYGKELLVQDPKAKKKKGAPVEPEGEPKDGAVDQGKKALKGLFGF
jgi:hypothetical protein